MEQHPIPQDVTGFQFKLIGSMTVKQFGYVAAGAILAVICWYAPVQGFFWQFIAKGILLPIFGLSGVIVAFIPIEGRPVDVMTANFFKTLISPNQYIYIKKGRKFSFTQITLTKPQITKTPQAQKSTEQVTLESQKEKQLRAFLSGSYQDSKNALDQKELAFLKSITTTPHPIPQTRSIPPQYSTQNSNRTIKNPALQNTQLKPLNVQNNIQAGIKTQPTPHPLPIQTQKPIQPTPIKNNNLYHIPDTPNVIIGLVKDSRGNILPNILVEVKDKEGNPVRAFKTNPLGQFASATALSNGEYTIELEDPKKQHVFDLIQIKTLGQIMQPIEIRSHDAREDLRRALFN